MRRILFAADRVLNHDFCPWANRYVYWLKRPLGWLVIAAAASALVGAAVAPQGLIVCGAIVAVILLGLCWPWISLAGITASLQAETDRCHEDEPLGMTLEIRNRWPWPVWGLTVERDWLEPEPPPSEVNAPDGLPATPIVALDRVPAWSHSQFEFTLVPRRRGVYPCRPPAIRCGFPFGLAQPGRLLAESPTVLVWPRVVPLSSVPLLGGALSTVAASPTDRTGEEGDVIGVREYRAGDPLRHIHWIQTARRDTLMVRERQSAARQPIRVILNLDPGPANSRRESFSSNAREWTLRVGASICRQLQGHYGDLVCELDGRPIEVSAGRAAWRCLLDEMASWQPGQAPSGTRGSDRRALASGRARSRNRRFEEAFTILVTGDPADRDRGDATRVVWLHESPKADGARADGARADGARADGARADGEFLAPTRQGPWVQLDLSGDVPEQLARQWERRCL